MSVALTACREKWRGEFRAQLCGQDSPRNQGAYAGFKKNGEWPFSENHGGEKTVFPTTTHHLRDSFPTTFLKRGQHQKPPGARHCRRLWWGKLDIPGIGGEGGGETKKGFTAICCKPLNLLVRPKRFELLTYRFVACCSIQLSYERVQRRGN